MKFIDIKGAKNKAGHYSAAVEAGNFICVSGQIPVDPITGEGVKGDITEQTLRVLKNLDLILDAAEAKKEDIMKVTIYVSDINLWDKVNIVYKDYFKEHKPARAIVPTRELHYGYLIELEAIIYRER